MELETLIIIHYRAENTYQLLSKFRPRGLYESAFYVIRFSSVTPVNLLLLIRRFITSRSSFAKGWLINPRREPQHQTAENNGGVRLSRRATLCFVRQTCQLYRSTRCTRLRIILDNQLSGSLVNRRSSE